MRNSVVLIHVARGMPTFREAALNKTFSSSVKWTFTGVLPSRLVVVDLFVFFTFFIKTSFTFFTFIKTTIKNQAP